MATKYIVLQGPDLTRLERDIVEYLGLGYSLQGGISAVERNNNFYFFQAMVKAKELHD